MKIIWTIGHSTHSFEEFAFILKSLNIECVADIRSFPGSRKYPHFNKESLEVTLPGKNIEYIHLPGLGGRRKVSPDSKNTNWYHPAFRGYADYMETDSFKTAVNELENLAIHKRTAYMCAEAVWWRCHRSLVSDWLKLNGWIVLHISGAGKIREHTFTSASSIINGRLIYSP
ncbi:MAG TPA: DUF488 domain-containing protein [Bacteroidales bacterium]|nr:DUF488 domain-containing protein [Bacteroidales bacterium]